MYLILGKEDFEKRSVTSKECTLLNYPHDLRVLNPDGVSVMHLGSNRVKRLIEKREGKVYFPDKPDGWKDSDCIFLACTYSDVKTVGGIVMHKDEARQVGEAIIEACKRNTGDSHHFIETMGPY